MTLPGLASLPLLLALFAPAHALPLAPQYPGLYFDGDGANSRWVQVAQDWRGSIYGDEAWGTGIWGLADHATVMSLNAGGPQVVQTLETVVEQINFGDQWFIDAWGQTWDTPDLAPLFNGQDVGAQDNWAVSFWGYIAIPIAGEYNFGVLFDDGFRFTLMGAGGNALQILQDGLNPRDRLGFAENLLMLPGLYAYRLDAYDRLEAGVTQLSWQLPGASGWEIIPGSSLFTRAVPEPATLLLLMAGLTAIGLVLRRQG